MGQNVLTTDLVIEHVEAVSRLVLRLAIQLDLKFPYLTRCYQTHRQSPLLPFFTSTPEVRALSSAGITRPHLSYSPLRRPDWPPPFLTTFGAATPGQSRASLNHPDHLLCMPCSIPRWTGSGARWLARCVYPRGFFPVRAASPLPGRVGVHIVTFEACSSFTRVTACTVAHPPYVGFIARLRPGRFPGSDARKLPSSTNNSLGGSFPHW